jgi:hypothetical protein
LGPQFVTEFSLPEDIQVSGYSNNAAVSRVDTSFLRKWYAFAERASSAVAQNVVGHLACTADSLSKDCIAPIIEKMWRRPPQSAELEALLGVYSKAKMSSASDGVRALFEAALLSPNFLFRSELGVGGAQGDVVPMTPFEIASALSYALTDSAPDAELVGAAKSGMIAEPAVRSRHIERLLQSPDGKKRVGDFFEQWLGIADLSSLEKDKQLFPEFTSALRLSALNETRSFALENVFSSRASFGALFDSNRSFVDSSLASLYGVAAPTGTQSVAVDLPRAQRGGVLTHVSVLSAYSHEADTGTVFRGKFVRERILCQSLPPPLDGLVPPERKPNEKKTTRQLWEELTQGSCQSCHVLMNSIGFSFENYDAIGRFRTTENGITIDPTGTLDLAGDANGSFTSGLELSRRIGSSETAKQCFTQQYFQFLYGRAPVEADSCDVASAYAAFRQSGDQTLVLISSLLQFPGSFQRRVEP